MQVFSNACLHVTILEQTIYECLSNEDVTVHNLLMTNNGPTSAVINLELHKGDEFYNPIPSNFVLRTKNTLEMKPINLMPGDILKIRADTDTNCDCVASILKEVRDF
jgi:hypothetical protein